MYPALQNLSDILRAAYTDPDDSVTHSLTLRLEWQIGTYWVPREGFTVCSEIYYREGYDAESDDPEQLIAPENIIAYLFWAQNLVLVKADCFAQFCRDTAGFGFTFYPFPSLDRAEICCDLPAPLPFPFSEVTWIDDDFMDGDGSDFDFDAYYKIDAGTQYLNPKHFSVKALVRFLDRKQAL